MKKKGHEMAACGCLPMKSAVPSAIACNPWADHVELNSIRFAEGFKQLKAAAAAT